MKIEEKKLVMQGLSELIEAAMDAQSLAHATAQMIWKHEHGQDPTPEELQKAMDICEKILG